MIRKNSKVKVQIFDSNNKVIKTMVHGEVHGEVFNVHEENGKLGITWNKEFKPFSHFAPSVHFENVMTGREYHFSSITDRLERI